MATILDSKSIYYNDVNLIAQPSRITSRSQVPKELNRIIVSPMESIVGDTFAHEANKLGLTICLHRFCEPEKQAKLFYSLPNKKNVFVSVGANDLERVKILSKSGAKNFLIDIANGYIPHLKEIISKIKGVTHIDNLMVGNVMTGKGFVNCIDKDVSTYVRIGIAGGSPCSTSDATGFNRGQITEIMEVCKAREEHRYSSLISSYDDYKNNSFIVADGGIKNGNYAAKAFGVGSQFCMMGGYFSKALEAETNINGDGTYWGGASYKQQERWGGIKKHSEGKVIEINKKELKPLKTLVDELWGGLSSAVSYSGYETLSEFIGNGIFEIKQNSLPPNR